MSCVNCWFELARVQKKQEIAWHQHLLQTKERKFHQLEKEHKEKLAEHQNAINSLSVKLNSVQEDLKLKTKQMERLDNDYNEKSR